MEGQRKGSALVLNDYTGLKLLGWGQTGNGCFNDSEAKTCVTINVGGITEIIMLVCVMCVGF